MPERARRNATIAAPLSWPIADPKGQPPPVAESVRVLHLLIRAQRVEAHIHIHKPGPVHWPLQQSRFVPHPPPLPTQHTPLVQGVKQQSPSRLQKVWGAWQPQRPKELQRTLQHSASFVQRLWSGRQEVRVAVAAAVLVAVVVAVFVAVPVAVDVLVGVRVTVPVFVGVFIAVPAAVDAGRRLHRPGIRRVFIAVPVAVDVLVGVCVTVPVFVGVFVPVGVAVSVWVGAKMAVAVGVLVEALVGVHVGVLVDACVGEGVAVPNVQFGSSQL